MFTYYASLISNRLYWAMKSRLVIIAAILILLVAISLVGSAGGMGGGASCPSC